MCTSSVLTAVSLLALFPLRPRAVPCSVGMVRQPFHRALYSLELCLGSARISPELQRYGGRAPDG